MALGMGATVLRGLKGSAIAGGIGMGASGLRSTGRDDLKEEGLTWGERFTYGAPSVLAATAAVAGGAFGMSALGRQMGRGFDVGAGKIADGKFFGSTPGDNWGQTIAGEKVEHFMRSLAHGTEDMSNIGRYSTIASRGVGVVAGAAVGIPAGVIRGAKNLNVPGSKGYQSYVSELSRTNPEVAQGILRHHDKAIEAARHGEGTRALLGPIYGLSMATAGAGTAAYLGLTISSYGTNDLRHPSHQFSNARNIQMEMAQQEAIRASAAVNMDPSIAHMRDVDTSYRPLSAGGYMPHVGSIQPGQFGDDGGLVFQMFRNR